MVIGDPIKRFLSQESGPFSSGQGSERKILRNINLNQYVKSMPLKWECPILRAIS